MISSPKESVSSGKRKQIKLGFVANKNESEFKMPRSPRKKGVSPKAKTTPTKVPSRSKSKEKKTSASKSPKEVDRKNLA